MIYIYIAGIQVTFDLSRPVMDRVVKVAVRCAECRVPVYEPLDLEKWYRISLVSYLVTGGDGYTVIANNLRNHVSGL
jgi:5'-nucleotidase